MHAKVACGLGLIVVDYLLLLTGKAKSENRTAEVSYISRQLKRLAKDLNCPVMALSQLNRGLKGKTDKRPGMADLRESGAIEQDANVIAFLYRDDYYTKDACGAPGISELIVAKNRQGETGTCYLQHRLQCSSFDDYTGRARTTRSKRPRKPPADRTTSTFRCRAGAAVAAVAWRQETTNEHDRAGQGTEEAAHQGREPSGAEVRGP
jgi:hypothetical protein